MKNFVYALAALSLTAGGAMAASSSEFTTPTRPAQTVEVPAGDVMTARELSQAGLAATDLVTITRINTTSETASIDNSSRGFY
ncbi:MAG: hypothetical protein ACK41Y_10915 [Paracoccus hibiscisoli]|uniref:hypothetical protein n=1 Tax=Paracoccus hibiscisoli TaxID=2023261 RepID=UPI003918D7FF